MTKEQYDAMAEGSYWFCLNDLSYYVKQFGWDKVMKDYQEMEDNRKLVEESAAKGKQYLDDVPF